MGKIEKIGKLAEKGKAEKIVAFVRDKDKQVSLAAITALGKMADNEDAKNTLVSMVENEDADIRRAAVTSLGGRREAMWRQGCGIVWPTRRIRRFWRRSGRRWRG